MAYRDTQTLPHPTVRHSECSLLLSKDTKVRCETCTGHRQSLNILAKRLKERAGTLTDPLSHANYRYLSEQEKDERLRKLHHICCLKEKRISRLQQKLAASIEQHGIELDYHHDDFHTILREESRSIFEKLPEDSFQRVFWQQQLEAASRDKKHMKWHPSMIRWCIYIRHQSGKAYDVLRESGAIALPSQRTLRDYTHYVRACTGFSDEVDQQLASAANLTTCAEHERLVVLLLDEMHVQEDLVYDKYTGTLVGFSNLGETNAHLAAFEQQVQSADCTEEASLAKTIMVFMVRGLFTKLKFPYAQFPISKLKGHQLFDPFWEAVSHLERLGFRVSYFSLTTYCNTYMNM